MSYTLNILLIAVVILKLGLIEKPLISQMVEKWKICLPG